MATLPVGYLVWTTFAELGENLRTYSGLFIVVLLAFQELARWVFSGLIFGYVYPELPGHIGAAKAVSLTIIWMASSIGPLLVAHATGHSLLNETLYLSAQFGVFMIVLAVVFDYRALRFAGRSYKDFKELYTSNNYTDAAPTIVGAAALIVTLFQQLLAGSGGDVVSSLLSGLPPLLTGGR